MKIALCQINTTVGDISGNVTRMLSEIESLRATVDVVVFPELAACGYPPTDHVLRTDSRETCARANDTLIQASTTRSDGRSLWIIFGTIVPTEDGSTARLCNGGIVAHNGEIVGTVRKTHLPTYDIYDELRFFAPGSGPACTVQMGDICLGIAICEDFWRVPSPEEMRNYPRDLGAELAARGATHLLNLSASPWHAGKVQERFDVVGGVGRQAGLPLLYANLVGGNDALIFDGRSLAWNKDGEEVARAAAYAEDRLILDLTQDNVEFSGTRTPAIFADGSDEDLAAALAFGIRDFLRKCGVSSVLIGLSGGIDSAVTACLAVLAVGAENVTGVAMPSAFSSSDSLEDAQQMATALGIDFLVSPIQPSVETLSDTLNTTLGRPIQPLASENLQARIRGTILMALANDRSAMVLNTGNKSELAVGYCTLYGDMAGGLAVLGDLNKSQVYAVGRAASHMLGGGKIPGRVFTKAPTAELRPDQLDSDSLPPYPELDSFIEGYIVEGLSPAEAERGSLNGDQWAIQIEQQQFKRDQAPPILRVSAKAFGMGRRMAIAKNLPR